MSQDLLKAALALICMAVAATVLRRQLAAMDPADAARTRRNILFMMLAAAALTAALAVYALNTSGH